MELTWKTIFWVFEFKDYFDNVPLLDYNKRRVYGEEQFNRVEGLTDNIIAEFRSVRRTDISSVVQNLCIQDEIRHFEHSL